MLAIPSEVRGEGEGKRGEGREGGRGGRGGASGPVPSVWTIDSKGMHCEVCLLPAGCSLYSPR